MKKITIARQSNLRRLYGELITAIPALAPEIRDGEKYSRFQLESGTDITNVIVDDAIQTSAVNAVLTAHDSTPDPTIAKIDVGNDVPTDQEDKLAEAATNLRQYLNAASPTNAQTLAALKLTIRIVLFMLKRQGF